MASVGKPALHGKAATTGKVLIIVQNLPVPFDRRVWLEATTLHKAGYQVTIISPTGKKRDTALHDLIQDIRIYRYPAPPEAYGFLGYFLEFAYCWLMTAFWSIWIKSRHGFDLIHACNPPETYFLLALLYKPFGVRFIFDHHDLSPEMFTAKGGQKNGLLYRSLLLLEWLTFRTADVVITTNQSHKEVAICRGNVPASHIYVVRSGPDFERLQLLPPEPALKDQQDHLVCYLGEMCVQDGVDRLLLATKVIIEQLHRTNIKFVLIGGGPDLPRLRQMCTELGLDGWVDFTGRVSDHDLCRYLSTADVCVDPDPLTEWADQSTMNKIMEYMAFAKPIVAFNLRENRYSAQAAAVYATPNNVYEMAALIVALLDNEEERKRIGNFGQQRVNSRLAWSYSIPSLLAAYDHALSQKLDQVSVKTG